MLILYLSVKVSGVVDTPAAEFLSLLLYVPEIVPVIIGSFFPIATSIVSLLSLSYSTAIFTFKLLAIVLCTESSIDNANKDLE